jgi:putative permease
MQLSIRRLAIVTSAVFGTIAGAFLLYQLRSVVLLLMAAIALAAMLRPAAGLLMRSGLSRSLSGTLLVLLVFLGVATFLGVSLYVLAEEAPRAATEAQVRIAQLRASLAEGPEWQQSLAARLPGLQSYEALVAALADDMETATSTADVANQTPNPEDTSAAPAPADAASGVQSGQGENVRRASGLLRVLAGATGSVAALLTQFMVLIFLSLYWSLEYEWFERLWVSLLPARKRARARDTWRALESNVGAHLRSEFVQVAVAFVLLWLGYWFAGVPYALLFAWSSAILWLIPLVGWLMALLPLVLLSALAGPVVGGVALIWQLLVFAFLEFFVEPRLDVRRRAGSIAGLLVAMIMLQEFGLVGLLFAGPVAVALSTLLASIFAGRTESQPEAAPSLQAVEERLAQLRTEMEVPGSEIPLRTRDLYRRLEDLVSRVPRPT